jgi:hypothetical protein
VGAPEHHSKEAGLLIDFAWLRLANAPADWHERVPEERERPSEIQPAKLRLG